MNDDELHRYVEKAQSASRHLRAVQMREQALDQMVAWLARNLDAELARLLDS